MSSHEAPKASRLRTIWRATSRRASSAPRRSYLLMATTSAKSSMSIFSSCEAAPYSGVMTYSETSQNGTMAASPWPMPGVSTTTRSYPAAWHAAMTSPRCSGSWPPAVRVASERKKIRDGSAPSTAFIRMRSPSRAPPPRRRVGSTARTATRSLSSWSSRNRRSSSSVSDDLPEPPVPVIPRTGTCRPAAASASRAASSGSRPSSSTVMARASAAGVPSSTCATSGPCDARSTSHDAISSLIMPARPSRWPSSGAKILTPRSASSAISSGTMTPPPPPKTCTSSAPTSRSRSLR